MKVNKKQYLRNAFWGVVISMIIIPFEVNAQQSVYVREGQFCPDFKLDHITNYPKDHVNLKDFKGRWLVMDFWSKTCSVCIKGFPELNELQKTFKDKARFLLIGKNDNKYDRGIEQLYERVRKAEKLNLTCAFDTTIFEIFGVTSTPHVVIIDPMGQIKAITYAQELNQIKLADLFNGGRPAFIHQTVKNEPVQQSRKADADDNQILINENNSLLPHTSRLSQWKPSSNVGLHLNIDKYLTDGKFITSTTSLARLYLLAYIGQAQWNSNDSLYLTTWPKPLLEVSDTSKFHDDFLTATGLYNYELQLKDNGNRSLAMQAMQHDLKQIFGYRVRIKRRMMPCLKLIAKPDAILSLRTKGGTASVQGDHSRFTYKNIGMEKVIQTIWNYHQSGPIFIDHTGIKEPIDLELNAVMTDLNLIKSDLSRSGLNLVKDEKEMNVIVISDR